MLKQLPLLLCLLSLAGCEANVEIAAEEVRPKGDSAPTTSTDAERRRPIPGALRDRLAEVRRSKIKVAVQADLLARRSMGRARIASLAPESSVEIARRTPSPTNRATQRREDAAIQLTSLREAHARLQKTAEALERKQVEIERRLAAFQNQIAIIDSHRIAFVAMKKAAEALEGTEADLAELEAKLADMEAEVEGGTGVELARMRTTGHPDRGLRKGRPTMNTKIGWPSVYWCKAVGYSLAISSCSCSSGSPSP